MPFTLPDILSLSYFTNYDIPFIRTVFSYPSLEDFFKNLKTSSDKISEAKRKTEKALKILDQYKIKTITLFDPNYPQCLHDLTKIPPVLFYKGNLPTKTSKNVAIVGTRDASPYAEETVKHVVSQFKDFGVVSGLALGVDTLAHKAALAYGQYTLAVLAHSIDKIYPKKNIKLADEIVDNRGCILSELPPGISKGKFSFIERNRLQVAFSEIVFPIEMSMKGGTMSTVMLAEVQEKEVWVIRPGVREGKVDQYKGIQHLIESKREGVRIVEKDFKIEKIIEGSEDV